MHPSLFRFLSASILAIALSSAGARAADATPTATLQRELSTDGVLLTQIDFEGGWEKIGREINEVLPGTSLEGADFVAVARDLGLSRIRAVGVSSKAVEGGYDNRFFLLTPEGRSGLLAALPGEPATFRHAHFAPADADFFFEGRVDVAAIRSALVLAASHLGAESADLAAKLAEAEKEDPSLKNVLGFSGSVAVTFRLKTVAGASHREDAGEMPDDAKPPFDAFAWSTGGGSALLATAGKHENFTTSKRGKKTLLTDKNGFVLLVDGETIAAATSTAFLDECVARKDGLDQSAEFTQALAQVGEKGHLLTYIAPQLFGKFRELLHSPQAALLDAFAPSSRMSSSLLEALFPNVEKPNISVVTGRPDGILTREHSAQSYKVALPGITMLTPDVLGLYARVAARWWAEENRTTRAREVVTKSIEPQLKAFATAARAWFAEHPDEQRATLRGLRESSPEAAQALTFDQSAVTSVTMDRGTDIVVFDHVSTGSVDYTVALGADERAQIEGTLRTIDEAAALFFASKNDSVVSMSELVSASVLEEPTSIAGEDYSQLFISRDEKALTVRTPGGQEVSVERDLTASRKARRTIAERRLAIERNLAAFDAAAQALLRKNSDISSVSRGMLAENDVALELTPVAGEDYDSLSISRGEFRLSIRASLLGDVEWVRPPDAEVKKFVDGRLEAIDLAASSYFTKNPKADLVISGELLPADQLAVTRTDAEDASSESLVPDLGDLVIRRDYEKISVTLGTGHVIERARSKAKK